MKGFQVGDEVAALGGGYGLTSVRRRTVARVLKTRVVLDNGDRYRTKDARMVGVSGGFVPVPRIEPWDDDRHGPMLERWEFAELAGSVEHRLRRFRQSLGHGTDRALVVQLAELLAKMDELLDD